MESLGRGKDYVYTIQDDPRHYYTGVAPDGSQCLLVIYYPDSVWVLFDKEGNLIGNRKERLPDSTIDIVERSGYTFTESFLKGADLELVGRFHQRGFQESPIRVKQFFLPEYYIGILDLPELCSEILAAPSQFSDEDCSFAEDLRRRWASEGRFQICLNPDSYRHMNRAGEVEAS